MRTPETTSYQHLWTPEHDALLGTDTDAKVAKLLGRTRGAVKARRFALGIEPRPRKAPQPAEPAQGPAEPPATFAARLKHARATAGLTQAQAAEKAGCDLRLWERYEAGDVKQPSATRLVAIARALGVGIDRLL